jgi:membrane-associated HD superfamily phosphohydrolase
MENPEQENNDKLLSFLINQLDLYEKYHDSKENSLWLAFSLYLTFSVSFIYFYITNFKGVFSYPVKTVILIILSAIFTLVFLFIKKQIEYKNTANFTTIILKQNIYKIIDDPTTTYTINFKEKFSSFPICIEEEIKSLEKSPENIFIKKPEFPLILLLFLAIIIQKMVVLFFLSILF